MANKPTPTRTTNPLHFEDLEPHRFEDLVRRLIYDFRPWRDLEATGRSGSDEGFDVRAFEIVSDSAAARDGEEEAEATQEEQTDRVWLIQCKREKSITPKKLSQYLDALTANQAGELYGIVLAAACDFCTAERSAFPFSRRTVRYRSIVIDHPCRGFRAPRRRQRRAQHRSQLQRQPQYDFETP